jgi:hypothetical protein
MGARPLPPHTPAPASGRATAPPSLAALRRTAAGTPVLSRGHARRDRWAARRQVGDTSKSPVTYLLVTELNTLVSRALGLALSGVAPSGWLAARAKQAPHPPAPAPPPLLHAPRTRTRLRAAA